MAVLKLRFEIKVLAEEPFTLELSCLVRDKIEESENMLNKQTQKFSTLGILKLSQSNLKCEKVEFVKELELCEIKPELFQT